MIHLSFNYIGETCVFEPRIPCADDMFEGHLPPRICVSPSILGCFMGITGNRYKESKEELEGKMLYIYKTKETNYIEATDVPDYFRTKEKYFTEPTEFQYIGKCKIDNGNVILE